MEKEHKKLSYLVSQWNESRLDLFRISEPNEKLEFHGVIRFYSQDSSNNGKYATKCVRVSSTASTTDVIVTLAEKFRSDMRMLTKPKYGLYEVHVDGETRKLQGDEKPLVVQLGWVKDDREGRFLLRNEDKKGPVNVGDGLYEESEDTIKGFKLTRNLTKREKKQQRKNKKQNNAIKKTTEEDSTTSSSEFSAVKHLYNQVPESTFTRTVSNPEAVMKKRREQKMQKRGADVVKIYGDSLNPEIPYKSLLLLPSDKTEVVVRDALDKYGLEKEATSDYNVIKIILPPGSKPEECFEGGWGREVALTRDECPLMVQKNWQPHQGTLVFQLRKQPQKMIGSKSKSKERKPSLQSSDRQSLTDSEAKSDEVLPRQHHHSQSSLNNRTKKESVKKAPVSSPKLLQLTKSRDNWIIHRISPNVTEIGCNHENAKYGQFIQLHPSPELFPCHCVITNMDGVVTVTPHEGSGKVLVNGKMISETKMLAHEDIVNLGRRTMLVFCDPGLDIPIPEIRKKMDRVLSMLYPEKHQGVPSSPHKSNQVPTKTNPTQRNSNYTVPPAVGNMEKRKSAMEQYRPTPEQQQGRPRNKSYSQSESMYSPRQEPVALPASITVMRGGEKQFLSNIFSMDGNTLHFKLSPSYTSYMFIRSLVPHFNEVVSYLSLITELLDQSIQLSASSVTELAFWMANSSEILNFMRQDVELSPITVAAQDKFAKSVQLAFRHLVQCMQNTLFSLMPAFLSEFTDDLPGGHTSGLKQQKHSNRLSMYDILHMLSSAMTLLRRCRVNAALTIQLFSQLFHSINMWLFNRLVGNDQEARGLCCREWGIRIRTRLAMIETWAEKQGLELAADCHLARITQATHLLQAPKHSADDIAAISGTCFKLNSLQLEALLRNYQPQLHEGEKQISQQLIEKVVSVAQHSADELTKSDGRDISLKEDPDLQLPFLLPEDGYSCDVLRGVPSGLTEFINNSLRYEVEDFSISPDASGSWTVHFTHALHPAEPMSPNVAPMHSSSELKPKPEIVTVKLNKRSGGMGLSIVAARGSTEHQLGIYIRSVVKDGAADLDGRIQAGDQLISVDNKSLVGVDQSKAASLMVDTGPTITLRVAKQGAIYHGLATLITQPSPPMPQKQNFGNQGRHETPPTTPLTPQHQDVRFRNYPEKHSLYDTKKGSVVNQSTPDLNDANSGAGRFEKGYPRSAMSMISLQQPDDRMNYNHQNGTSHYTPHQHGKTERHDVRPTSYIQGNLRSRNTAPLLYTGPNPTRGFQKHSSLDNPNYENYSSISETHISSPNLNTEPPKINFESPKVISEAPKSISKAPKIISEAPSPKINETPNRSYEPPMPKVKQPVVKPYENNHYTKAPALKKSINSYLPESNSQMKRATSSNITAAHLFKSNLKSSKQSNQPVDKITKQQRISAQAALSPRMTSSDPKPTKAVTPEPPSPREVVTSPTTPKVEKSQASKTLGRPVDEKKQPKKIAKSSKSKESSKSSTLPRHFKSSSPWDRDERERREQAIQEELNFLRDEEIGELTERGDSLNSFEKDRLKNLLKERDFQMRVQEEKSRLFSDEDLSGEDYEIPDRPDRDRIIQLEDVKAQRDAANKEKLDDSTLQTPKSQPMNQHNLPTPPPISQHEFPDPPPMSQHEFPEPPPLSQPNFPDPPPLSHDDFPKPPIMSQHDFPEPPSMTQHNFAKSSPATQQNLTGSSPLPPPPEDIIPESKYSSAFSPAYSSQRTTQYRSFKNRPGPRPISDGYLLSSSIAHDLHDESPQPTTPKTFNHAPVNFITSNTPGVIGSQEFYNDPRSKRENTLRKEQATKLRGPDPSRMTFKDRQRLFQADRSSPVNKPRSSRKLMEIEQKLRGEMHNDYSVK